MNTSDNFDSMMRKQYADSENFMARVELNRRFSTNPYGWTRWIFDHIKFSPDSRILELGCGNAILWRSNFNRIPDDAHIVLSDFSEGMLQDARSFLGNCSERFEFKVMDIREIDFPDKSFDIIIANNMLYHIRDRKSALSEISRVIKDDGTFYAATFGISSMKELTDMINDYDPGIIYPFQLAARAFGLESGVSQLMEFFNKVNMERYEDELIVTEAKPLVDYALSAGGSSNIRDIIKGDRIQDFEGYINKALEKSNGRIRITKDSGIFISRKR